MATGENLRIEPGAAERIAKAFDQHAENLRLIAMKLRNQAYATGFAGFPSAEELNIGFLKKRDLAVDHLYQQIEVATRMAASIRAAGARYRQTDATGAATIRDSSVPVDDGPQPR